MKTFFIDRMATPQGELLLIADEENQLRAIDWTDHHDRLMKLLRTITVRIRSLWLKNATPVD